jgi:predicted Zn-dependent protease
MATCGALRAQGHLEASLASVRDSGQRNVILERALHAAKDATSGLREFVEGCSAVLAQHPQDPAVRYWRAVALRDLKLLRRAQEDISTLLLADPDAAVLHALQGDIALLGFDRPLALRSFARCAELRVRERAAAEATAQSLGAALTRSRLLVWLGLAAAGAAAFVLLRRSRQLTGP